VFGMGTGVAPPLSPPEFRCCPARGGTYSIVAGVALSGLFAKQVPANKAKRQHYYMPGSGVLGTQNTGRTRKN
jgi:hypothetical protein